MTSAGALVLCVMLAQAEAESPKASATDGGLRYERTIRPLLVRRCGECHSPVTSQDNGGLVLTTPAGLARGGSRGPAVASGKPAESRLIQAIRYRDPQLQMPPEGRMPEVEIRQLEEWIAAGAELPEYQPEQAPQDSIDYEQGRRFWAFQPLNADGPPDLAPSQREGARRTLDLHLREPLATAGLPNNRAADKRTLIRRVTFDLTGLPPSPEEVSAFLADSRADAFERVVDRLLASPRYGERWGRFWLDFARYTDTTASWLNSTAAAWLYRDWVVAAFNRDLPYDEFARLQLAADQIAGCPPEDLAALGFLGLSPTYWKELRLAPEVIRQVVADEWDERVDAVSRTFLGLTIACARCHDHKFDPISTLDYYRLASVFASTTLDDRPLLAEPAAQRVREARREAERLQQELKGLSEKLKARAAQAAKPAAPGAGPGKAPAADPATDPATDLAALRAREAQLRERLRQWESTPHFHQPWAHVVRDASVFVVPAGEDLTRLEYRDEPQDLSVFRRGNPENHGPPAPRGFPTVFSPDGAASFHQGSGRRELADATFELARPLAARVMVNRVWGELFGAGIVRTPSNFGRQGERPSHPRLLDHLAAELIGHGWSLKWLHRELVLSAAYRQSSDAPTGPAAEIDPANQLLGRMSRRRLPFEMWRDAMLWASGDADSTMGGAAMPLHDPQNLRRTLYATIARRELDPLLRLYDFPEPTAHSPRRERTTTPLQQLFVLNGPFLRQQAAALRDGAAAAGPLAAPRIAHLYQRLFARPPEAAEVELAEAFLGPAPDAERWQLYVHSLLGLNELLFLD